MLDFNLFSLFDAEGSASLSKEQFRQMFDHIPTHVIHMCPRTSRDEIVYHAFEECECNQNGEVDFHEYLHWIKQYQPIIRWLNRTIETSNETEAEKNRSSQNDSEYSAVYHEQIELIRKQLPAVNEELDHKEDAFLKLKQKIYDTSKNREQLLSKVRKYRSTKKIMRVCHHVLQIYRKSFAKWSNFAYVAVLKSCKYLEKEIKNVEEVSLRGNFKPQVVDELDTATAKVKEELHAIDRTNAWRKEINRKGQVRWISGISKMKEEKQEDSSLVQYSVSNVLKRLTKKQRWLLRRRDKIAKKFGRFLVHTGRAVPRILYFGDVEKSKQAASSKESFPVFKVVSVTDKKSTAENISLPAIERSNRGLFGTVRKICLDFDLDYQVNTRIPYTASSFYFPERGRGQLFASIKVHQGGKTKKRVTFDDLHESMRLRSADDANEVPPVPNDIYVPTMVPIYDSLRWKFGQGSEVIVDIPVDVNGISRKFEKIIKLMVYENCASWNENHNERDGSGHDPGVQADNIVEKQYFDICKEFYSLQMEENSMAEGDLVLKLPLQGHFDLSEVVQTKHLQNFSKDVLDKTFHIQIFLICC